MNRPLAVSRLLRCFLLVGSVTAASLIADGNGAEIRLHAQLIWATNDPKPKDNKCREVDAALREKLGRIFQWKNYFEIKEEPFGVKPGEAKRVRMSKTCELELRVVDDFTLEVKLFGEGKLTKTVRQSIQALRQGELSVLAGDSKDRVGDAWFVVLSIPKK